MNTEHHPPVNDTVNETFGRWWQAPRMQAALGYGVALLLCLLVLGWTYDLRRTARQLPFYYQGDAMYYHITTKALLAQGWYQDIPQLGAPGQLNLRDVPTSDNNLHFLLQKLLSLRGRNYHAVLNNFFLLTFPLVMLCVLFALRQLGLSWPVGTAMSLLYTFLPYHIIRNQHHLFLSAYWQVPLFLLVLFWLLRGELSLDNWRTRRGAFAFVVAVLLGSSGYYYAFFACFFLVTAAGLRWLQAREWRSVALPFGLIALITLLVVANLYPSIRYISENGPTSAVSRVAGDADAYGLRLAQILMPVRFHRWKPLADFKTEYNLRALINENDDASLGFVGALGFLGLVWWFLFRRPPLTDLSGQLGEAGRSGWFHQLSTLTVFGFLLATIGGFGSLVALFGVTQLRAYNRISIFLGFFCLLAVGLWLEQFYEWLQRKFANVAWLKWAGVAALALLVWLALLDQISPYFLPNFEAVSKEYESDARFVKLIEAQVPRGAMIFQLPVMSFPENPKVVRMFDYDLARPYLHSDHLRWTYGTIKGREDDFWVRRLASMPVPEMAANLVWAGFNGVFIDRFGYADNAVKYENEFTALLGRKPSNAANGRHVFFDLSAYALQLRDQTPPSEWAAKEDAARHPVMPLWQQGFHDQEGTPDDYWRWCAARGRLQIANRSDHPQTFELEASFFADNDGTLQIWGFLNEELPINRKGTPFKKQITIPPGLHTVRFAADSRRILTANDFREIVFRVRNFKLKPLEAQLLAPTAPSPSPTATP